MTPWAVARPARLAACASPRLRRSVVASSMSPLASVNAALHSIIPAPVLSRSCFTCSAVIAIVVKLRRTSEAAPPTAEQPHASLVQCLLAPLRGADVFQGHDALAQCIGPSRRQA